MSTQNKLILRRFFEELFNQGKLAAADEIVSATNRNHNAAPGETPGRVGLTHFITDLRTAFRNLNFTIDDQVAEGDKVVTRWNATGIYQGKFAGVPVTGKPVVITAINIHRVAEGQIQPCWINWDAWAVAIDLNLFPII